MKIKVAAIKPEESNNDWIKVFPVCYYDLVEVPLSGKRVMSRISNILPDIVIIDLNNASDIKIVRTIKNKLPLTEILVFTDLYNDKYLLRALEAGASDYLLKNLSPIEMVKAINKIDISGVPLFHKIEKQIFKKFNFDLSNEFQLLKKGRKV